MCRTRFVGNTSNAYGAGFFSVMYDSTSRSRFEDTTFDGNRQLSSSQFAGGAYVQGGPFAFERVSVVNNEANGFTGLFLGPGASGTIRNGTFVGNVARQGLGAGLAVNTSALVSIVNTTIASHVSTAAFAGGISVRASNQLRLTNVILANNTGGNIFVNWNIQNAASQDGGGNMQWPAARPSGGGPETPATPSTVFQNPLLAAAVAANGGFIPTIALTPPSPARDTGVSGGEVPPTDARGAARVGAPDRGSFELEVPSIGISDAAVAEGNAGTVLAAFTVTMSRTSVQPVTVQWATVNDTATAPSDYVAASGQVLTFSPGQLSQPVSVAVNGDTVDEADETFFVNLSNPSASATLGDAQGIGTIVDDDPSADLFVTKTDGVETAAPGQMLTYTSAVGNAGPNDAAGATVSDPLPSGLTAASWTCVATGGASCGSASGSGSISQTVGLPVGGTVTYTLTATVAPVPATVRNTATVTVPPNFAELNPSNNGATDDDLLVCDAYTVVVPDGRLTATSLGAGATAWHLASLRIGSSYSAEFTNRTGGGAPMLTVFRGDDGCGATSTAVVRDTTAADPPSGASGRVSFTGEGADARYRLRLVNGTGSTLSYTLSIAETTLFSPAWSTNATFDTYYSFQNTTNADVAGTLTLLDVAGTVVATSALDIPAGRTIAANTSSLGVVRNRTGTARLSHDGPPGSVVVESAIANFTFASPYVQPVRFVPAREQR